MAALSDMRAFFRWLEDPSTTVAELDQKRQDVTALIARFKGVDANAEASFLLLKIEEELLARLERNAG